MCPALGVPSAALRHHVIFHFTAEPDECSSAGWTELPLCLLTSMWLVVLNWGFTLRQNASASAQTRGALSVVWRGGLGSRKVRGSGLAGLGAHSGNLGRVPQTSTPMISLLHKTHVLNSRW